MSRADELFINMCKDIIENGYSTEGGKSQTKMGGWRICLHHKEIRRGEQV